MSFNEFHAGIDRLSIIKGIEAGDIRNSPSVVFF